MYPAPTRNPSPSPWPRPSGLAAAWGRAAALTLALLASAFLAPPTAAAQNIRLGVDPLRASYQLAPAGTLTNAVHVSNLGNAPVPMTVTVNDWRLSPRGTPVFAAPGMPAASPNACASWLRVNPAQFAVGPGQTGTVRYTIQVPAHAPAQGCHAAILFTSAPFRRTGGGNNQILTRVRLATILYITVGHPVISGHVTGLSLAPPTAAGGSWRLRLTVVNTGNTFLRASGALSLLAAGDRTIASFPLGSQVVLPQTDRVLRFAYSGPLAPGNYELRAQVDIGLPRVQQIEKAVAIAAPVPAAPATSAPPAHGPSQ